MMVCYIYAFTDKGRHHLVIEHATVVLALHYEEFTICLSQDINLVRDSQCPFQTRIMPKPDLFEPATQKLLKELINERHYIKLIPTSRIFSGRIRHRDPSNLPDLDLS